MVRNGRRRRASYRLSQGGQTGHDPDHPRPAGWTPFYPFEFQPGLPLNAAGLMWGPPSSMTMSKPSWHGVVRGHDVERWLELGSSEKWMACYYGDHGQHDAILSQPIDAATTECTVTYPKQRGAGIEIICKW